MSTSSKFDYPRPNLKNPIHFLAFGGGVGCTPVAPGTAGTLLAVLIFYFLSLLNFWSYLFITLCILLLGIFICQKTSKDMCVEDHPGIVWDEITGFLITMIGSPREFIWILIGFLLFRFFDILKPWPIGWVDKNVKGGAGIMLDDILAGIISMVILNILLLVF
tara:strand:+ start:533 stop:1021 length:489 start_codon:yes stop_codon:yes gene_type:complete